jgi:hypothetical protein
MKSGKFDNKTTKKTDSKSIRTFSYTLEINNVSHNFYEVDRIKNVTSDQLPFKNHVSHFQTTRNIRTSELLPLIHKKYGIKSMSIMFNHIDKNGFNDISPYKINMFFCKKWDKNNPKEIEILKKIKADKLIFTISHLKNYLIETAKGDKISIITSGNPKISSRYETYSIYNSVEFFNQMINVYEKIEIESKQENSIT